MITKNLSLTVFLSLLAGAQLTAATTGDTVSPEAISSLGMVVSILAFAIGVFAIGAILRKRGRRHRTSGLSHLQ